MKQVCVSTMWCLLGCVFSVHGYKYCVCGCLIYFFLSRFVWAGTSVCIYLNLFTHSVDTALMLVPDGEWALRFILSVSLPLVFLSVSQMEEEPYNPDYVEVDRVLEVSYCEDKDTGEVKRVLFHLLIISEWRACVYCVYMPAHVWHFFSPFNISSTLLISLYLTSAQGHPNGLPCSLC